MNHGNLNNKDQESTLDRLNRILARLMGKKDNKKSPYTPPSNLRFSAIALGVLVVIWSLTGLYYIPKDCFGVITHNGKVVQTLTGISVGFTRPYPFADVAIVDNDNTAFSLGKESDNPFYLLSSDTKNIQAIAEVDYSIIDPAKYFISYYQDSSDLSAKLSWDMQARLQSYFIKLDESKVLAVNKLVAANEIAGIANKDLNVYGLKIENIKLISLQPVVTKVTSAAVSSASSMSDDILNQAKEYARLKQEQLSSFHNDYYPLLAQYDKNPRLVEDMLYYRMLSKLPESAPVKSSFTLLELNKEQFLSLDADKLSKLNSNESNDSTLSDPRSLNRSVVRDRVFLNR